MDEERKWYRAERIKHPGAVGPQFDERWSLADYPWKGFCGWGSRRNALQNVDLLELSAATQFKTVRIRLVERTGDKSTEGRTHKGNTKTTLYEVEFDRGVRRIVHALEPGR